MTAEDLVRMGFGRYTIRVNGKPLEQRHLSTAELYSPPPIQFLGHFLNIDIQRGGNMKFEKVSFEQFRDDYISCFYSDVREVTPQLSDQVWDIYQKIRLPERATAGSAGYDFFMPSDVLFRYGVDVKIPTGIKVKLDQDKFLMCVPRSGLGFKFALRLMNTQGIIDADYYNNPNNEGHIFAKMRMEKQGPALKLSAGEASYAGHHPALLHRRRGQHNSPENGWNGKYKQWMNILSTVTSGLKLRNILLRPVRISKIF